MSMAEMPKENPAWLSVVTGIILKPSKKKATEKIDGVVALVMALSRALIHSGGQGTSVYDTRGLLFV